jgi:SAM-dependent methyltransferase
MLPLSKYSHAFLDFLPYAPGPALDIGAAYGVSTIPALERARKVIANDIESAHLGRLLERTPPRLRERLELKVGRFPNELDFDGDSLGAILLSHVLPLLEGDALEIGAAQLFRWLAPGGKVFITAFTPYNGATESFIEIYEARRREGRAWPGFIDELPRYLSTPELNHNLPETINLLDAEILKRVFGRQRFVIEALELFPFQPGNGPISRRFCLDGRELVGVILRKD